MAAFPKPEPGKRYVLFRRPEMGNRHWWASIVMPDKYTEIFDTKKAKRQTAAAMTSKRVFAIYKERGIESPAAKRKKKGRLSAYQVRRHAKLAEQAEKKKPRASSGSNGQALIRVGKANPLDALTNFVSRGRKAQTAVDDILGAREDDGTVVVGPRVTKMLEQYALAFVRMQELIMLGSDKDPESFVIHMRAICAKALHAASGKA